MPEAVRDGHDLPPRRRRRRGAGAGPGRVRVHRRRDRPVCLVDPAPRASTLVEAADGLRRHDRFLTGLMLLAAVDAFQSAAIFGVDSTTIDAEADGVELAVTYGVVSRPRWRRRSTSRCTNRTGFDARCRIAVEQAATSALWDENGLVPAPSSETVTGAEGRVGVHPPDRRHARFRELRRPHRAGCPEKDERGRRHPRQSDDVIVEVGFHTRFLP